MNDKDNKPPSHSNSDRLRLADILTDLPWPGEFCLEALLNKIENRPEDRPR